MVSRNITTKTLSEYTPAIDPRREGGEGIISGRNFMNGVDGPGSAFASSIAVYRHCDVNSRAAINSYIAPSGTVYYGTPTGVYSLDPTTRCWTAIVPVAADAAQLFWPWSYAYVGGLLYFAQHGVGLYSWDETNRILKNVAVYNSPSVISICESYGRLIYLTPSVVGYSALDNGTDTTPSTVTGAGFQAISLIGGTPFHVGRVGAGFVVATSNGLLLGRYVTAAFVFSFQTRYLTVKIFSPNAAVELPDIGIAYLDAQGVRLYDGSNAPQDLDPVMGQFLKDTYLQPMNRNKYGCLKLSYSLATKLLYVQIAPNAREGQFINTYPFFTTNKTWGSFDATHYGVVDYVDPTTNTLNAAYMGVDGYLRYFQNLIFTEDAPGSVADFRFTVNADRPAYKVIDIAGNVVYVMPCNVNLVDPILGYYYSVSPPITITGMYATNEVVLSDTIPIDLDKLPTGAGTNVSPYVFYSTYSLWQSGMVYYYPTGYILPQIGLDSKLVVGPYRYEQQFVGGAAADETATVNSLIVGVAGNNGLATIDDWASYDGLDDWLADPDAVDDLGIAVVPNIFTLSISDTDDGINSPFFGDEILTVIANLGAAIQYSPVGNSSIFHTLTFSAVNAGEFFAVKSIDMAGTLTGRRVG